jgi:hypothetical protein
MIFSSFDVVALIVQAVGGSGAASAEEKGTSPTNSTHILVSPSKLTNTKFRKEVFPSKPRGT